ncbi:MAG: flavin reductase family protein [Lachnospiraceae bacterium]|nr:flavin reductase family protein [Lachnospiraceae bacterium]
MSRQFWKPGNMLYPLPAVMVSCQRPGEKANIITLAWVGTVNSDPPMVSISVRPERYSYDIIRETGEFVINLTTESLVKATDYCGVRSGRDVDKFKEMGLHPCQSKEVSVPGIDESPVCMECRVKQELPLGSHTMFIAEVLAVSVDERYMNETGKFSLDQTGLIAYSHGEYLTLGDKIGSFGYSVRKKK